MPLPLQIIIVALFGLAAGSFGGMLLYRLPRGESILGRSRCPHTGRTLTWWELIPLFSFIILHGKSYGTQKKISLRYPLVEIASGALFISIFLFVNWTHWILFLAYILAGFVLLLIAFYDSAMQTIPDVFTLILVLCALIAQGILSKYDPLSLHNAFIGSLIPLLFFGGLWLMSRGKWIGSGDVLLGAGIGLLLGLQLTLLALFLAYAAGAVYALILIVLRRAKKGTSIAFGPFLSGGALLALLAGEEILHLVV